MILAVELIIFKTFDELLRDLRTKVFITFQIKIIKRGTVNNKKNKKNLIQNSLELLICAKITLNIR